MTNRLSIVVSVLKISYTLLKLDLNGVIQNQFNQSCIPYITWIHGYYTFVYIGMCEWKVQVQHKTVLVGEQKPTPHEKFITFTCFMAC